MLDFYSPNMPECMGATDSESINNAVRLAAQSEVGKVVIPRINARTGEACWSVDRAILLPSDFHIVLDNCYIRQADATFDNVFRNENMYTDGFATASKEQRNIVISGVGNAVIDGGEPNGLTEKTSLKDGNPHIVWNNTILLHNVDGFVIENIKIINQRWWAIDLIYATNGRIDNITFDAKDNIPNQDGLDLRCGCHNISVSNIFGQAGDDLVALSGFMGFEKRLGLVIDEKDKDIYNVTIRNVVGTSVTKAVVALRNHDEIKLYDVTVDGVTDTSGDEKGNNPYAIVRVGQKTYSNVRPSILGETSRIFINNVHAAHGDAVLINATLCDSRISNIFCAKEARTAFSTRSDWAKVKAGAYMENVTVSGILCDSASDVSAPLIELEGAEEIDGSKALCFENISVGESKRIINADPDYAYIIK